MRLTNREDDPLTLTALGTESTTFVARAGFAVLQPGAERLAELTEELFKIVGFNGGNKPRISQEILYVLP